MPKTPFSYSVSFEYDLAPVMTHRGSVSASSAGSAARQALKEARCTLKPRGWRSVVVVLER
jgi:hypothetical protein